MQAGPVTGRPAVDGNSGGLGGAMSSFKVLQDMFKRYRRPGDLLFALVFLAFSFFLAANLGSQTTWFDNTKLAAQPAFWPTVSILMMAWFASLHALSAFMSERLEGRWAEVRFWLRSLEYVAWFMAYVFLVPQLGYLPSTILFMVALTFRIGYRDRWIFGAVIILAIAIVVLFKSFLQVKVPGGKMYELLPDAARAFMLTYF